MILEKYLHQIESYIPSHAEKNAEVSKVNVAWQLDHSLNVLIQVTEALRQSDPKEYKSTFNLAYEVLNFLHWIPRGKGKAPKTVLPDGEITEESIRQKLAVAKEKLSLLTDLDEKSFFPHPYFGHIKKKRAIRFLGMHTKHHLKIVKDVLRG
jgi:hypothetical protein